ncbi:MAG TPA: hypothetical protein VGO60_11110 [Iamia sp.]|jgi:Arc/MetJ-type ribon-helix-helix transcriptional regulator|nr:hypothetical protein [Iamia sp.]
MSSTTVRLDPEDQAILDQAAQQYGSRSAALRAALRLLDEDRRRREVSRDARREARRELLEMVEAEDGPIDPDEVQFMRDLYKLDDRRRRCTQHD